MNENLNLVEILKDCPKGTKLYSPMLGKMEFIEIYPNSSYPIIAESKRHRCTPDFFTKEGKYIDDCDAQCMLFPSKDNHDWSTFKVPNKLPKTWEEFCKNHPVNRKEYWIDINSNIMTSGYGERENVDRNLLPNKEYAKAMLALYQLIQLRDCYNEGWQPDWSENEYKYCIEVENYEIVFDNWCHLQRVLTFKTKELRDTFLNNFKDLIEIAKPLL